MAELTLSRDDARDRAQRAETELNTAAVERRQRDERIEELHLDVTRLTADLTAARAVLADHAEASAAAPEGTDQGGQSPRSS